VSVAVEPQHPPQRRTATGRVLSRLLGRPVSVSYRPDGRPEAADLSISAAHGASVLLVVAGAGRLGCDLEPVDTRGETAWRDLLGGYAGLADLVRRETGESVDEAGTRVWCAVECLQKAGEPVGAPLTLESHAGAWTILASAGLRIATCRLALHTEPRPVVAAVLVEERG
jgi:enediyne polyketide synthase